MNSEWIYELESCWKNLVTTCVVMINSNVIVIITWSIFVKCLEMYEVSQTKDDILRVFYHLKTIN